MYDQTMLEFFVNAINFGLFLFVFVAFAERNRALNMLHNVTTTDRKVHARVRQAVAHLRGDPDRVKLLTKPFEGSEEAREMARQQLQKEMRKLIDMDRRARALEKIKRNLAPQLRKRSTQIN